MAPRGFDLSWARLDLILLYDRAAADAFTHAYETAAGAANYPAEWWHWSFGDRYWAAVTGATQAIYEPR